MRGEVLSTAEGKEAEVGAAAVVEAEDMVVEVAGSGANLRVVEGVIRAVVRLAVAMLAVAMLAAAMPAAAATARMQMAARVRRL